MITFGRITDIVNNRKKVKFDTIFFDVVSIDKTKQFILRLNRIDQIFESGESLDGNIIGFYSPVTESLTMGESFTYQGKSKRKKTGEPYFLVDSGKMFDSFSVMVDKTGFTITAYTIKDGKDLETTYKPFVGLNDNSIEKLIPYLTSKIRDWILLNIL